MRALAVADRIAQRAGEGKGTGGKRVAMLDLKGIVECPVAFAC
jgi:hypothetical protein